VNTQVINPKLLARIKDKKYRDLYVASHINKFIPYQLRALRAARGVTQAELAEGAETKQSVISRIESKGAANLNVQTLLKLASAFDVALVIRFVPIDKFVDWVDDLSPRVMSPKPSKEVLDEIEAETSQDQSGVKDTAALSGAWGGRTWGTTDLQGKLFLDFERSTSKAKRGRTAGTPTARFNEYATILNPVTRKAARKVG
jgi:transcriptional regulator with XRE-family HTH domain